MIDMSVMSDKEYLPTLYNVHRFLDQTIVGEFHTRMSVFTAWILAEKYVMISGGSRSGKTWVKDNVKELVKSQTFTIKPGSAKSGWRDAQKIQKCRYVEIPELNKIPQDMNEALKDWGEQKDAIYKTRNHLNGQWETYKLPYRPFVFCVADENNMNIPDELRYRLVEIRTDSSRNQNRRVMMDQAYNSRLPHNSKTLPEKVNKKLIEHIKFLPPLAQHEFKHPAADILVDAVPDRFADCRTAFPIYLDNCYGIQRFHWKEAITGEVKGIKKKVMFVSPQVMWLNHYIFGTILINSSLKCSDVQKRILKIADFLNSVVDRKTIQSELHRQGVDLSGNMVAKHLNKLSDIGYLDKNDGGNMKTYKLSEFFENFKFKLDWPHIIDYCAKTMENLYPEYAYEYVEKYCKNPVVMHPFTGEEINLLDLKGNPVKESNLIEAYAKQEVKNGGNTVVEEIRIEEDPSEKNEIKTYFETNKNKVNAIEFDEKFGQHKAERLIEKGVIIEMPRGTYLRV